MISFLLYIFFLLLLDWNYDSVMAGYFARTGNLRATYLNYRIRVTLRNSIIYCIRFANFLKDCFTFFHRRLSPNVDIDRLWPPFGIQVFNPFQVSAILLKVWISPIGGVALERVCACSLRSRLSLKKNVRHFNFQKKKHNNSLDICLFILQIKCKKLWNMRSILFIIPSDKSISKLQSSVPNWKALICYQKHEINVWPVNFL